ncbi:hypothetical protein AN958_09656 [Leucoagaricus sp. SymC.cos]|nr:hypothetical protein AN958_09656 [Leucoagaricus sp. SymC.cos]
MSSDVASVRAEIKAWEHKFKETNGKEPTVADIKRQPAIAQKYKLYKKLSKTVTTASSSDSRPSNPPSTPPRQTSSASKPPPPKLLLSASRLVETTAPLASFNPFSPQKKDKGKQKEAISTNLIKPPSNPFVSPRKRGEPVSPSPNKEKRRRVLSPSNQPFPKLHLQISTLGNISDTGGGDDDEDQEDNDPEGGNSSFVDDSPMKPAANGKTFTFLFEETVRPTSTTELFGNDALTAKAQPNGQRQRSKLPSMDEDIFSDDSKSSKAMKKSSMKAGPSAKSQPSALPKSRSKLSQTTLPFVSSSSNGDRKRSPSETRPSNKRVKPEQERGTNDMSVDNEAGVTSPSEPPPTSALQLLPPSPNPNVSRQSGKSRPNGARSSQSSKVATSRKKAKLQADNYGMVEDMENDDGSSSDGFNAHNSVKLVHHSRGIRAALPTEEAISEVEDPILNYAKRVQPRGQDDDDDTGTVDDEKVESTLPNELRRVLVLETLKSKRNEHEKEKIVKGLLSGRRILHYDPRKGGEIWGAGEDERDDYAEDEDQGIDEGADEWEGDPVPWEVGELSESHYHLEEL